MKQLKTTLQSKYVDNFFYIVLFLTSCCFVIYSRWYLILAIPYWIWFLRYRRNIVKTTVIITVVFLCLFVYKNHTKPIIDEDVMNVGCFVLDSSKGDKIICTHDNEKIIVYTKDNQSMKPGDTIIVTGKIFYPEENKLPNTFNYRQYLLSQDIYYGMYATKIEVVDHTFHINLIRYYVMSYIDNTYNDNIKGYVKVFVLGYKYDLEKELLEDFSKLGIMHLFVISGMHIGLFVLSLNYVFKRVIIREKLDIYIGCFLLIYVVITGFSPSVLRGVFVYLLSVVNKRWKMKLSFLDMISIVFIVPLLYHPYYMYDIGFILAFLISFFLVIGRTLIEDKDKVLGILKVSFYIQLVSLPIMLRFQYEVNLLSSFVNVLMIPFVLYIFLPSTVLILFVPKLSFLYEKIVDLFEQVIMMMHSVDCLRVQLFFNHEIFIIVYYILIYEVFVSLEKKKNYQKRIIFLVLFLMIMKYQQYFVFYDEVEFLNVGQGDSMLIQGKWNRCNMLIDTGDIDEYDTVVNYLKSKNVMKLDTIVITHSHSDHNGELFDLLDNFVVNNIVVSEYDEYEGEEFTLLKSGDQFTCGEFDFDVVGPINDSENVNNISLVLRTKIGNDLYLLTGDAEQEEEMDLIEQYDLDVDILKVGHHGSDTSTTELFLQHTTPSIAIISVSEENRYRFPDDEVLNRLYYYEVAVYQTKTDGTICICYFFDKYRIINLC